MCSAPWSTECIFIFFPNLMHSAEQIQSGTIITLVINLLLLFISLLHTLKTPGIKFQLNNLCLNMNFSLKKNSRRKSRQISEDYCFDDGFFFNLEKHRFILWFKLNTDLE